VVVTSSLQLWDRLEKSVQSAWELVRLILGIGVVPIAMLASLIHGSWTILMELAILAALTFGIAQHK
jgi:hypothetical protein